MVIGAVVSRLLELWLVVIKGWLVVIGTVVSGY